MGNPGRFLSPAASLGIVLLALAGCTSHDQDSALITPADAPRLPARGFFMGVLPSPASGQDWGSAYAQAAQHAEWVPVWGQPTPFYDLAGVLGGDWGRTFVEGYIRSNGMFPLIHLSFFGAGVALITPPGMEGATLSTPEWRRAYTQAALDVVRVSRPLYLSLGNEVNRWLEKYGDADGDPNGFRHFLSLYEETYDAVKQISPAARVFCTFAREIQSEHRAADLGVLGRFKPEKLDLLVLTSYPYSVQGINLPSDIPVDYYSQISNYLPGKPFGFSELGWPARVEFGGEQGQADFLAAAAGPLTRDRGVPLHLFGWAWLHDLDANDFLGLIRMDGTEKTAYGTWKTLSGR